MGFWPQLIASGAAIGVIVAVVAWAKIAREWRPLDAESAAALFRYEFDCDRISELWLSADGEAAVAHAGAWALVAWRVGDGWRLRKVAFARLSAARAQGGRVRLRLDDPATPPISFTVGEGAWPPALWTAAPPAAE